MGWMTPRAWGAAFGAALVACSPDATAPVVSTVTPSALRSVGAVSGGYTVEALEGLDPFITYGVAYDINASGDAVGVSTGVGSPDWLPTLWRAGSTAATNLGVPWGDMGDARAINDSGHIVGISGFASKIRRVGFIWRQGVFTIIDPPGVGGTIENVDLNNRDEVVGTVRLVTGTIRGFRYTVSGQFLWLLPPGYTSASVGRILEDGTVVGAVELPNGDWHLAQWSPGNVFTDLGAPAGFRTAGANDSNAGGVIVGFGQDRISLAYHSFIWRPGVGFTVGSTTRGAAAISDRGRMVGSASGLAMTKKGGGAAGLLPLPLGASMSFAFKVNACGHAVGYAAPPQLISVPVRWKIATCD